ncbi:uncharacterized protein KGF55_005324 [Candida pseudojiufengensis]|uniref:uncharacterized protein n=1 Tax=Candida pseudojiufengensis TaxID=497109 RepID=UPI002224A4DC|nr:uncharacterized protein KGF55_005324 [Candida pseudojiufengensis]KAI5959496.1 hypothetical protein KGF55_005324 [Candida pseudojiufengensis]
MTNTNSNASIQSISSVKKSLNDNAEPNNSEISIQDNQNQNQNNENQSQQINILNFNSNPPISRKIQPSLQLINNNLYSKKSIIYNDPKILSIYQSLKNSSTIFITSIFCFIINLNNTKFSNNEKLNLFKEFYLNEQFYNLPYVGEIELNKEEFEITLNLFNELYFDYNFITLSDYNLKNKNKFQQVISEWFKIDRGINMENNKEFMREILSAGLNDWYLHLQR